MINRCGAGPVLGGALKDMVGFAWTATFFGAAIVTQAVVVTVLSTATHGSADATDPSAAGEKEAMHRRLLGRRMSESHDAVRGFRGGLAAPSADLTSRRSDEDF